MPRSAIRFIINASLAAHEAECLWYQKPINKKYCYVCDSSLVNEELKKFMIPVYEAVPNILSINEYDFKHDIKTKKYETKKIK